MRILIVGAGLEGVTTAWYLARDGHEVIVMETREGPGLETSYANGGQISVSHPEPWANPQAPLQILRWLGKEDAPLLFRFPAEWARWRWGLSFLRNCTKGRSRHNTRAIAALAGRSLACLRELRSETGLDYNCETRGVLHLFFTDADAARAPERAQILSDCGLNAEVVDRERCLELEPALAASAEQVKGGLYGIDDESGDARQFTVGLAELLERKGVEFRYGVKVRGLGVEKSKGRVDGVDIVDAEGRTGMIFADAVVLAAGPWSQRIAARVGERLPIYPVKGYSITVPVIDEALAPRVSLTDEARRIVCARLGSHLRVAGTAELAGFDVSPNPERTQTLMRWVETHFPGAVDLPKAETWCGLRPATPSNVPIIGASRLPGLWFNTGHGTLGWTLACGSANALADLIAGRDPSVAGFPFLT
ncbi:MAG: D-amino acid dehydrogenase [Betaproteobacteria bacterium]|nr:D-amino acid dehydrogenase [Betaproteobacteria bacterium]